MKNILKKAGLLLFVVVLAAIRPCYAGKWAVTAGYDTLPVVMNAPELVPYSTLFRSEEVNSESVVQLKSVGASYMLWEDMSVGLEYLSPFSFRNDKKNVFFDYQIVGQAGTYSREYSRVIAPELSVSRFVVRKYIGGEDNVRANVSGAVSLNKLKIRSSVEESLTYSNSTASEYSNYYDTEINGITYIVGLGIEFKVLGLIFQVSSNIQSSGKYEYDAEKFNYFKFGGPFTLGETSKSKGDISIGGCITYGITMGYRF